MKVLAAALLVAFLTAGDASAQSRLLDSYCTQISENDKYASDGYRLRDAASIIRQDRANFHKFGIRDPGDEGDRTFRTVAARARIPQMVDRGATSPQVFSRIVGGQPYICIDVRANSMDVYIAR